MNAVTQFALNRRRLLLGLAAASTTAAGATVEAISAPAENPELIRLGDDLPKLVEEFVAAGNARTAILEEWVPRWPTSPKSLHVTGRGEHETGLAGESRMFPSKYGELRSRSIWTSHSLGQRIAWADQSVKLARKPANREKWEAVRDEYAALLPAAHRYEAKCRRIRERSGYASASKRLREARAALVANITETLHQQSATMAGVVIQSQAVNAAQDHLDSVDIFIAESNGKFSIAGLLASSLLRIAGGAA